MNPIAFSFAQADTRNLTWYNEDGTTYATTVCTVGEDVILPTAPTKTGYTFKGWARYQVQEYIESTGIQYIDTGLNVYSSNLKVELGYDVAGGGTVNMWGFASNRSDVNWFNPHASNDTFYIGSSRALFSIGVGQRDGIKFCRCHAW